MFHSRPGIAGGLLEGKMMEPINRGTLLRLQHDSRPYVRLAGGKLIQGLEMFLKVHLDRTDISSKENHLSQHWLPLANLKDYDVRPHVVRDVVANDSYKPVRHLIVPL